MSSEFPFMGSTTTIESDDLPILKEYAWNFETDKFVYDNNGNHVIVEKNEALKVWIYKALKTERFDYMAYSWQYGIELKPFIGKVMSVQERFSELKRVITECLMVNPYIVSIDSFSFDEEKHGELVKLSISLTSIYGEVNIVV
ncbi:MAG: DUF2634 domain-containing protein [Selenomonas sp.]|nr:DUF2634 domain-containing protein [Selenomonas sp.]